MKDQAPVFMLIKTRAPNAYASALHAALPPLADAELESLRGIYSGRLAGMREGGLEGRPFRAPHHTISSLGLRGGWIGGAKCPIPGEATLAHHGTLVLGEIDEFSKAAIGELNEVLRLGEFRLPHARKSYTFPAQPALVVCSYVDARAEERAITIFRLLTREG